MELLIGQEHGLGTHLIGNKTLVSLAGGVPFGTSGMKHPFKNSLIYEYERIRRLFEIPF